MIDTNTAPNHGDEEWSKLVAIPLDKFLQWLEKWISNQEAAIINRRKPEDKRDSSIKFDGNRAPSKYTELLTRKLEGLDADTKTNIQDTTRNAILWLYKRLFELQQEIEGITIESSRIKWSVNDLLNIYSFYDFKTLAEFTTYLHDNELSSSWNQDMLKRFMSQLRWYTKTSSEKKIHFSMLLKIPGVKSCYWDDKMLTEFSQVLKQIDGEERNELRILFNALPKIMRIPFVHRTHKCWKILNPRKTPQRSLISSSLGELPGRAWVVRYPSI